MLSVKYPVAMQMIPVYHCFKPDDISLLAKFIDRVRTIGDEKYGLVAQCLTDGVYYEPKATIVIPKFAIENPDPDSKITEMKIRLLEKEEGQ